MHVNFGDQTDDYMWHPGWGWSDDDHSEGEAEDPEGDPDDPSWYEDEEPEDDPYSDYFESDVDSDADTSSDIDRESDPSFEPEGDDVWEGWFCPTCGGTG